MVEEQKLRTVKVNDVARVTGADLSGDGSCRGQRRDS